MTLSNKLVALSLMAPLTPLCAFADVHVTVTATVSSNSISSGPFASAAAGDPVTVSLDAVTPGTVTTPGQSAIYSIDQTTLTFDVGGTTLSLDPSGSTVVFLDNFPTLDGFCVFTGTLNSPGYQFQMLLRDTNGVMFSSENLEQLSGSYPSSVFTQVVFSVTDGGGNLIITAPLMVIDPPGQPPIGTNYCSPALPNSTGLPARIEAFGSTDVSNNQLTLVASDLPPGQFGYFLAGQTQGSFVPPGSSGVLCLTGNIGRFNSAPQIIQGPMGSIDVHLGAIPVNPPTAVQPGDTWNFQCWHRDPGTSNFTDGVTITYQ